MIAILILGIIAFLISPFVGCVYIAFIFFAITIGLIVHEERENRVKAKAREKRKK